MRYEHTIDIAAPVDAIWRVLADIEHWPDWTPTMTSIEALDPLPLRVGLRARVTQPGLRPAVLTVTAVEEGRRFLWGTKQPGLAFNGDHVITSSPGGSRVRLLAEFTGLLAPVVGAIYGKKVRAYVTTEAESLKARVEGSN